jgi:S1-C subfamily serine protease
MNLRTSEAIMKKTHLSCVGALLLLVGSVHAQTLVGPEAPVPELRFTRQNVRSDGTNGLRCAVGTITLVRQWQPRPFNEMNIGSFVEVQATDQAAPPHGGRYFGAVSTKQPSQLIVAEEIENDDAVVSASVDKLEESALGDTPLYAPLIRRSIAPSIAGAQIAVGHEIASGCAVTGDAELAGEVHGDTTKGPVTAVTIRFTGPVMPSQFRRLPALNDEKRVVASLRNAQGQSVGAGIILGQQGNYIYIATCKHVVWSETGKLSDLSVTFFDASDRSFPASVLDTVDGTLDLAVVAVSADGAPPPKALIIGSIDNLSLGSTVRSIGHPAGVLWRVAGNPEKYSRKRAAELEFESTIADEGSSGGALFNACGGIVGMTTRAGTGLASASRIDQVLAKLAAWHINATVSAARCFAED